MNRIVVIAMLAGTLCVAASPLTGFAETNVGTGRETLAQALKTAWLPLESGLIAGSAIGTPLSAKYEIDDGAFQLSVYTVTADPNDGDTFREIIVDYSTGTVARIDDITDGGDLSAARDQQRALAGAKRTLEAATASAVKANAGYRAVSATPKMSDGRPVAEVLLLNGTAWKAVSEQLD